MATPLSELAFLHSLRSKSNLINKERFKKTTISFKPLQEKPKRKLKLPLFFTKKAFFKVKPLKKKIVVKEDVAKVTESKQVLEPKIFCELISSSRVTVKDISAQFKKGHTVVASLGILPDSNLQNDYLLKRRTATNFFRRTFSNQTNNFSEKRKKTSKFFLPVGGFGLMSRF